MGPSTPYAPMQLYCLNCLYVHTCLKERWEHQNQINYVVQMVNLIAGSLANAEILLCAHPAEDSFFRYHDKHFKVSFICVLLHNVFLTRTNVAGEILMKDLLFLWAVKPEGRFVFHWSNQKQWKTLQLQWNIFISIQTGSRSLRLPSLIKTHLSVCWQGRGPTTINDDVAKRQQDIINGRPNTSRSKLVNPSLHPLTC